MLNDECNKKDIYMILVHIITYRMYDMFTKENEEIHSLYGLTFQQNYLMML